jgi:hypothetical protein
LSDCGVDDVAATAAGATGLRAGDGKAACWRVAGANGVAADGAGATAAVLAAGADLGTALRAIGRGLGSGTFGLAQASAAMADKPTASARLVANAVDRNAAARAGRVKVFLCGGESFNRSCLRSI